MNNENTIKNLEALRDDFYRKYKSVDDTISLLKGNHNSFSIKSANKEEKPPSFVINDGYDIKWPMKLKMSHILKKESRFLHIRQIAEKLHTYEPLVLEKEFVSKLYPAIAELKKSNTIVKYTLDNNNVNTFWGSKNWVDSSGKIKDEYIYDLDQVRSTKADIIEI